MDRLSDMRLFLSAASAGSFSAAGRKVGLSPAASSAAMQRLEQSLGVKLFERTTRQLRLTEEGRLYQYYCQQAIDAITEAEHQLQAGKQLVQGTVRISAPSDLGRNLLQDYLLEFSQRYPDVRFVLALTDSHANLVLDDVDVAIRYGKLADSSMVARTLVPNRRVICVAPACDDHFGPLKELSQLAQRPALVLTTAAGPMNVWQFQSSKRVESIQLDHYHETNDGEILRKWAVQGRGYAYKSALDIVDDVRAARLRIVLPDKLSAPVPLHALYHRNKHQPPRVKLLLDFLQERFAAQSAALEELGIAF
jgi:DNA-binding transcriptional LysR family regulator